MTPQVRDMKLRAKAALEHLGANRLASIAADNKFPNVSSFLESLDPSDSAERRAGIDAFSRVLACVGDSGIRTNGDRFGSYYADPLETFRERNVEGLFGEWFRRTWISGTSIGQAQARQTFAQERANAQYLSNDFALGTIQRPYDDDTTLRMMQVEPAIPLAEIVTRTRTTNGPDYRARYLTEPDANDIRLLRVTETSELPSAKITEGSRAIRLYKYGRKLEASYEALRRIPLDDFAVHIRKLALQTEVDQVGAVIDTMVNGDGNANTSAVVHNLLTLDPATTSGILTLAAWLNFRLKWPNPYGMTHVFARASEMMKVLLLTTGNANTFASSANLATLQQDLTPINNRLRDGVRYGITTDAPANLIIGADSRFAVERAVEAGSDISETERWITSQREVLTFSINEGYSIIDTNSVKALKLDA